MLAQDLKHVVADVFQLSLDLQQTTQHDVTHVVLLAVVTVATCMQQNVIMVMHNADNYVIFCFTRFRQDQQVYCLHTIK